ncbi:metallophosphoesterase [Roseomonas sp. AR75]|uniref:metallophosphoesterase n=1 Tax=Roseomonas sp. AR75 TaxID=2562311 RepID=UPI0010C04133|nr:metallophosphoesterase [Roseomonas sp. AR75]
MSDNAERAPGVRLRIAVLGDTHLEPASEGTAPRSNRRCRAAIGWINALKPDLVVHLGDVVHPLPSLPDQASAFDAAAALFAGLQAPMLVTPGNHDIGDKPNPAMPAAASRQDWAEAWASRIGPLWESRSLAGCRVVLACASLFGSGTEDEAAQWRWLEETLRAARSAGERVFLFTHYPPFIRAPDEPGHYDNLDPAPRARLLALATHFGVEAILSGHAHAFFLNGLGRMRLHVVPSVAFARRDYAELARVAPGPGEEFGRNETGRLGFALLDVLEEGHALHPVMTGGSEDAVPAAHALPGLRTHPRLGGAAPLGLPLHHPWAEVVALPTNPPTAPFRRRLARDDRTIQLLWRLGATRLRIPREDLEDAAVRARLVLLAAEGFRVWLATAGVPDDALIALVAETPLDGWEITLGETEVAAAAAMLQGVPGMPAECVLAPMRSTGATPGAAASALFVGSGLAAEETPDLAGGAGVFTGWMARIGRAEAVAPSVARLALRGASLGLRPHATVCLMPERPDESWCDDVAIAARVAEARAAALAHPGVALWLDTFLDVDRGYHVRNGLADRRMNPRAAGWAFAGGEIG